MPNSSDCRPGKVDESQDSQFGTCPVCGHVTDLYRFFLTVVRLDPSLSGLYHAIGDGSVKTAALCPVCGHTAGHGSDIGITEDGRITKRGRILDAKTANHNNSRPLRI